MGLDEEIQSVLDPDVLADLRQLDAEEGGEIIDELIDAFLASGPGRLAAMRNEAAAGRAGQVRFLAHAFKGSSGVLGACKLADACRELEVYAGSGLDGRSQQYLDRIEWEFERARAAFVAMRKSAQ